MRLPRTDRGIRSLRYVIVGTLAGVGYAVLNTSMDYFHEHGVVARAFVAFHDVVDNVIPVLVGALLGVAVHYLRLRSQIARDESAPADQLRARVEHVERDQAVWVVAAATLHELKTPIHCMGLLVDELGASSPDDLDAITDLRERLRAQMDRALVPLEALRSLAGARKRDGTGAPVAEVAELVVRDLSTVTRDAGIELRFEGEASRAVRAEASFVRIILENPLSLQSVPG